MRKLVPVVIEVQRARGGWIASEGSWKSPVYPKRAHALNHARERVKFREGEIRIHGRYGGIERTMPFSHNGERKGGELCLLSKLTASSAR
jgi:hypothetical protein